MRDAALAAAVAMRAFVLTCLVLAAAVLGTAATATANPIGPPPVGGCNAVRNPCWNGALLCVWVSEQVPQCVTLKSD